MYFVQFHFLIHVSTLCVTPLFSEKHIKWKHSSATSNVPLISELFTLFLVFSTPVGLALFSNCLSELGRQLLPAYCLFIRGSEITRDSVVSFWQPVDARSKDWKYSLSPTVQNEKFTIYPVHVLQHRCCKSQAHKLDF